MSHDYPNMEAYSAAENRLLDIISPQKEEDDLGEYAADANEDDEPFDEADATVNELGENVTTADTVTTSPRRRRCRSRSRRRLSSKRESRALGVHCPVVEPAVSTEVHVISSDTSEMDMDNIGSDCGDFMGFSDVDADEDEEHTNETDLNMQQHDTLNCPAPGIYGLRRCRKASTVADTVVTNTTDLHGDNFNAQDTIEDAAITAPITYTDANFEMLPTMSAPEHHIMHHSESVGIEAPPQQHPRRASIVYSYDHNNLLNIYADQNNCLEVETGENSGVPREIIFNDAYAIQTIVDNAGQQCIIYEGSMTDLVEADDENGMCIVEVPYNDDDAVVDTNQLGLNVNNMNLQFATTADNNICIVHQDPIGGIHERNQMAVQVAMENSQLQQQHMAEACLIAATDEPLNENVENLYYGIPPNANPSNNVIILSTMASEEHESDENEVYIDGIIDADADDANIMDTFNAEAELAEEQQQQLENTNMHGYDDNMELETVDTMLGAAAAEDQNDVLNITISDDTSTAAAEVLTSTQEILANEEDTHAALPEVEANLSTLGDNEFTCLFDDSEHVRAPEADHFLNVPTETDDECAPPLPPETNQSNQTQNCLLVNENVEQTLLTTKADNVTVEPQVSHKYTSADNDDEVIVLTDNVPTTAIFSRRAPPPIYKRCATSTTTEFPNSSNSNQNFSGDDLPSPSFAPRTPLLKNTLSSEALDRKLLSICQLNPQLSIEEKIDKWSCNGDYSDVEDVSTFDELLEKRETESETCNFSQFQSKMLENMKTFQLQQMQQKQMPAQSHEHSEDATESSSTLKVKAQRLPTVAIVAAEATEETTADTSSTSSADNRQERHFSTTYQHNLHIVGGGTGSSDTEDTNLLKPTKLRAASSSELTLVPPNLRTTETQTSKCPEIIKESIATSTTDLIATANVVDVVKSMAKEDEKSTQTAEILATPSDAAIDLNSERLPATPLKENEIPKDVSADVSAKIALTNNNQQEPNNCLSDALFYEQHEFCNYLGLTGLATANAVAIAMQELANSTIARRSLRVRTQQQLDRMRNDSLRGRKRTEKVAAATIRVPSGVEMNEPPPDASNNIHSTTAAQAASSQISTTTSKAVFRDHQIPISVDKVSSSERLTDFDENDGTLKFICKIPAQNEKENEQSAKLYDYFFKDATNPDQDTQQQIKSSSQSHVTQVLEGSSHVTKSSSENCDLEVQQRLDTLTPPTQPTPTAEKLHERMQQCLKQARETKPTIYIVKAMNNDHVHRPSEAELLVPHPSLEALPDKNQIAPYINESSAVGSTSNVTLTASTNTVTSPLSFTTAVSAVIQNEKKLKHPIKNKQIQKTIQRLSQRAKSLVQNDKNLARSLVTRSTTTLNSKQLRSRKVSLMKSYYLTNDTRSKRLSGGSVTNSTLLLNKQQKASTAQSVAVGSNVRRKSDAARNVLMQPKVEVISVGRNESPKRKKVAANNLNKQNIRTNTPTMPLRAGETEAKKKKLISTKNATSHPIAAYPTKNKATANLLPRQPTTESRVKTPTKSPVVVTGALQKQQQQTNKIIRSRANSTPVPGTKANFEPRQTPALLSLQAQQKQQQLLDNMHQDDDTNDKTLRVIKAPVPLKSDYMPEMNTHEFITNRAVVCPTAPTAAVRRLMWTTARNLTYNIQPPSTQTTDIPRPVLSYPTTHGICSGGNRQRETAGKQYSSPIHTATDNMELNNVRHLTSAWTGQRNPLVSKHGKVLYMFYEQEMLIVVQEKLLSFWKYSKIFTVLRNKFAATSPKKTAAQAATELKDDNESIISCGDDDDNSDMDESIRSSIRSDLNVSESKREGHQRKLDWVHLGRVRRVTNDIEVNSPYGNRICINNSIPVYLEMRCRQLDHNRREGKLLSTYVNVYYYSEEDLRPKMHSVHLDAVPSESAGLMYTTIIDSRYFVLAWPQQQEMMLGKTRTGLCKYSLTPSLDTLASIREFKNIKHAIKYIECLGEDKLIGYGPSRVTIWDHRSGDTIMNYDLCMDLGHNLGALYYPGLDVGQCGIIVLYQQICTNADNGSIVSELQIIACEISCSTPSHRILQIHKLPTPQFDVNTQSTNTGDHIIIKSSSNEEIWISSDDPQLLTFVAAPKNGAQRYYSRSRSHVIEVGKKTLTVNSIANHMLKLASEMLKQPVNTLMSTSPPLKLTNRK